MFTQTKALSSPRGGALLLAAACFAAGLTAGTVLAPGSAMAPPMQASAQAAQEAPLRSGYPAEVLRGIDAAELRARCDDERIKAEAARAALTCILAEGTIGVSYVGQDKFGGRVDADVSTARTPDVSAAMLGGGYARAYSRGRRESWCG